MKKLIDLSGIMEISQRRSRTAGFKNINLQVEEGEF